MNIFLKYSDFLNEGLATARKTYVSNGKISQEDFAILSSLDPTKTKKHLDKICEFFFNGINIEEIKNYIDKFDKLSSNLENKDINSYDFDTLKSTLDNYSSKSQMDTQARKDIDVVFENERYLVVRPTTHEQVMKYGRDTKWCITGNDEVGKIGWDKYYIKDMLTFYFIIDKTLSSRDPLSKVSIGINREGNVSKTDSATVNSKNQSIDGETYIKKCGLDRTLFKPKEITKLEKWGIDLSKLKDGVYNGSIFAPEDITEFRGFKEEFGLVINAIDEYLFFFKCKNLTHVGVLPQKIGYDLNLSNCISLESIEKLPDVIECMLLSFYGCKNLTSIGVLPQKIGGKLELRNSNQSLIDLLYPKFKLNCWGIDLSKLKDGVYNGTINAPIYITEFKGFKEEMGLEINEVKGYLSFEDCENLTSIGVLPETIIDSLYLNYCTSLKTITKLPKVIKKDIIIVECPFFEGMEERQIREKYNINENYHYSQYYQQQSKNNSAEPLVTASGGGAFSARYKNLKSVSDIQQKPSSSKPTHYSEKIKLYSNIEVTSAEDGKVYIGTFLKGIQNKDGDYIEITFLNQYNSTVTIKPKKIILI